MCVFYFVIRCSGLSFAACDFLFLLSTVVLVFVVVFVSVILDAGDRKQKREKKFI